MGSGQNQVEGFRAFRASSNQMEPADTIPKSIPAGRLATGILTHDLCTRCGTCIGACPEQALSIGGDLYPALKESACTACGLCGETCPGGRVDYGVLTERTFGHRDDPDTFDGIVRKTLVGYCTDAGIREGGAGGGLVTALCWDLLKHGDVDGCIVARMKPGRPWEGEAFIARTYDDLRSSQGSKYTIIPTNAVFQDVRSTPGRYAYVALPCQVHGFRLLAEHDPVLRERITCVIGLFCGGSLEPTLVLELLAARGIRREDIADFQFRGGAWPGKMRAILKNGDVRDLHYSNYKDGAYNYFTSLYMPARCQTCLDGSGLFADVSISDAWTRDASGNYRFEAQSRILARTPRGEFVVQQAMDRGSVVAEDVTRDPDYRTHKIQAKRKGTNAPLRTARRLAAGHPAPLYDRPPPPAGIREHAAERAVSTLLYLGGKRWFRYPLMKFLTSAGAIPLIQFRLWRKKRKYRRQAVRKTRSPG